MSYTTPQKALDTAHVLASLLKVRYSTKVVTESFDTDGNPIVTVDDGTPAAGEMNIIIKVMPTDWPLGRDVLGNVANVYTPHKILFGTEANGASAGPTLVQPVSPANLLPALGEVVLRGMKVEWYQTASGTAPTLANTIFASANLVASFYPELYNPLTNQQ